MSAGQIEKSIVCPIINVTQLYLLAGDREIHRSFVFWKGCPIRNTRCTIKCSGVLRNVGGTCYRNPIGCVIGIVSSKETLVISEM